MISKLLIGLALMTLHSSALYAEGCTHQVKPYNDAIEAAMSAGYSCYSQALDVREDPQSDEDAVWNRYANLWNFLLRSVKGRNSLYLDPSVEFFFYREGPIIGEELKQVVTAGDVEINYTEVTNCRKTTDDRRLARTIKANIELGGYVGLSGVCRRMGSDDLEITDSP